MHHDQDVSSPTRDRPEPLTAPEHSVARAGPSAGDQPRDDARRPPCRPFWNYRARWLLFYFVPATGLIGGILLVGWEDLATRNFWVPALWGLWMPWFNGARGPMPGLKRIVFRDFSGGPFLPLGIPLMHGLVWSACSRAPVPDVIQPALFVAAFLAYDILMIRYDLLQIHARAFARDVRPRHVVRSFLAIWWLYLGSGLKVVDAYGQDSAVAILGSAALLIAPMQALLIWKSGRRIMISAKKVAVIGAGWSGVYAAKWLLQAGLDVKVFERRDRVGGLWSYDEETAGTVSESTFASSSNFYMHASDFPMDTVHFPTHAEVSDFVARYGEHFGVTERVAFSTAVSAVTKDAAGWTVKATNDQGETSEAFDAVVVASGLNRTARDLESRYRGFGGKMLHSGQYKHVGTVEGYERILVVGLGESGADVAHECGQIRGTTVYLSGSRQWFAGRFITGGLAADVLMAPGIRSLMTHFLDFEMRGRRIIQGLITVMWGPGGSGVEEWVPPVPWLHGFVTKSRSAVADVHERNVIPKSRIVGCEGSTVTFEDGSSVEVDLIIDCTGFAPEFPFLDRPFDFNGLHRFVFDRSDPTLSFVGTARPVLGSIPGLAELQARWIAAVYSGRVSLPNRVEQDYDAFYSQRAHRRRFLGSDRRPNLVDHEPYAQSIAEELSITVPWARLLLTRPRDFKTLLLAPWMAFKYNLRGSRRAQAMSDIRRHMPSSGVYYGLIVSRFLRQGVFAVALWAALLALVVVYVPPPILVAVAVVFALQSLAKRRRAALLSPLR